MNFYESLSKDDSLYKEIDSALELLKENSVHGDKISRGKWPRCYVQYFDIQNLFRFELRSGRRLIFTVYTAFDIKYCNILECFKNHKEYEKRFGY